MIKDKVSEDANIIWGAVIDDSLEDAISVTVIATGFNADGKPAASDDDNVIVENDDKDSTDDEDDTFYDIMSIFNK